jgi:hypothetical protein
MEFIWMEHIRKAVTHPTSIYNVQGLKPSREVLIATEQFNTC